MRLPLALVLALVLCPRLAFADSFVIDDINGNATPEPLFTYSAGSVGWVYTPDESYTLVGVETRFGAGREVRGLESNVFLEIYQGSPLEGGALLMTGTLRSDGSDWVGVNFIPLDLVGGQDYFIGLYGVQYLGSISTRDPDAELVHTIPWYRVQMNPSQTAVTYDPSLQSAPILRFTAVPEPSTSLLLMLGSGVIACARCFRRCQRRLWTR